MKHNSYKKFVSLTDLGENIRKGVYWGTVHGVIAWTAYAIVECMFSSILSWIIKPSHVYTQLHWGFTVLLFCLYPAIGLILGGLSGICLCLAERRFPFLRKVQPAIFFPALATFTVILAFDVNLIVNYSTSISLSEFPPLFISLLLIFALALSARSRVWYDRLRFLTNPWTASIVLLGLPWINQEVFQASSMTLKVGAALAYPALIFVLSCIGQKISQKRLIGKPIASMPTIRAKSLIHLSLIILLVLGVSCFLKQKALVVAQNISATAPDRNLPNVILVTMDTVRADHLSLYGYERNTTPNLQKFTKEATLYTHAIAPSDTTLPTHASIFTGVHARKHGAHHDPWRFFPQGRPLAEEFETLAEILSQDGYFTIGVVANTAYLNHHFRLDQGFQYYDYRAPVHFFSKTRPYYIRQGIRNVLTHFASPSHFDQLYRRAETINREVFTFLDKAKEDTMPFFMFINYMDAHDPYIPPSPFDTLYPGKEENYTSQRYRQMSEEVMKLERNATEQEHRHLLSQYDGGIAYVDYHLGELIKKLKDLGMYENCLIIITADHGETFGERYLVGHGVSVYQDQVHVPLIVKWPNINEGHTFNEVINLVDLFPTILDVSGHAVPSDIHGESLLGIKTGKTRIVFSESFPEGDMLSWHSRFDRVERAVFSGPFKFIGSTAGKRELYDLSKDPTETKNLYELHDDASQQLETRLAQWLKDVEEPVSLPVKLDKEAIEHLRTLGYVK